MKAKQIEDRLEAQSTGNPQGEAAAGGKFQLSLLGRIWRKLGKFFFSTVTRRIVFLNLAVLLAFVIGILYLSSFRAGLIDARYASLLTQGEIIVGAIAVSTNTEVVTGQSGRLKQHRVGEEVNPLGEGQGKSDFHIDSKRIAPLLRRLTSPTNLRVRIYDSSGSQLLDSLHLNPDADLQRQDNETPNYFESVWQSIKLWLRRSEMPIYEELGPDDERVYPEVEAALSGIPESFVRVSEKGELIVSVAVPLWRFQSVLGSLLLSTQGGDIDAIIAAERMAIFRVFIVVAAVTFVMSTILASTIADPMHRLAVAADRVRRRVKSREEIPDFSDRQDEIGSLASALRDMTNTLYDRMEAIEKFAADVSHELKNPLSSLRSAVETLPLARSDESRDKLFDIALHDVTRLDRLISDISDASRIDAEFARSDLEPVNIESLLEAVESMSRPVGEQNASEVRIVVDIQKTKDPDSWMVFGHESRLGQVVTNLVDNAKSFSPKGGVVRIALKRNPNRVRIDVEDEGPGIPTEQLDRIFERFYSDRPEGEDFGNNSGLGLSISRQIIEAHNGKIWAENRTKPGQNGQDAVTGARFSIELPPMQKPSAQ